MQFTQSDPDIVHRLQLLAVSIAMEGQGLNPELEVLEMAASEIRSLRARLQRIDDLINDLGRGREGSANGG